MTFRRRCLRKGVETTDLWTAYLVDPRTLTFRLPRRRRRRRRRRGRGFSCVVVVVAVVVAGIAFRSFGWAD